MADRLPKRKSVKLNGYDYASTAVYFITICANDRKQIFSELDVGEGLAPPELRLKPIGIVAAEQLMMLEQRFESLKIFDYVIMPDHIHTIWSVNEVA